MAASFPLGSINAKSKSSTNIQSPSSSSADVPFIKSIEFDTLKYILEASSLNFYNSLNESRHVIILVKLAISLSSLLLYPLMYLHWEPSNIAQLLAEIFG